MHTQRRLLPILSGALLLSTAATRFVAAISHATLVTNRAPAACTLLSTADATKALEVPSQPGKELVNSTGCVWSSDPADADTSRRVTLVTHSLRSFQAAMHPAITTIKIEPVSGIGDEAFYQIYPHDQNPFIWVRKGDVTFDVRIITRLDPKPFTLAQEKAKDALLAKAAVAKL
jgi:hypothetical protein